MILRALGTGTIALRGSRVRAGYVIHAGDTRLLLDCGSGVTHRLAELGEPWMEITHVAITHFHIDHVGDLPTLIFAWKYGALPARTAPVELIGPAGTAKLVSALADAHGSWVTAPGFPLAVRELAPGESLDLGGPRLEAFKVPHTAESVAYAVTHEGRRLVYTGDTGFDRPLGEWARGCDVLLSECSLPSSMAIAEHLTPEQCGELAAIAMPGTLVLTHLYPPVESIDMLGAVRAGFAGRTMIAHDGMVMQV